MALKDRIYKDFSSELREHDGLSIRKLEMTIEHEDEVDKVQKLSLGHPTGKPTKVILLVGATGTGKTTLINNMVNFIYKVEFMDDFRFILIDDSIDPNKPEAESQTDRITAYEFNHLDGMPFEYNYVLIDTPGFGDTRGIEVDRERMGQMEMFFKKKYGVDSVDGVGFVTPSSAVRLTQTQHYVHESLTSMFGKDIKNNIFVMATFADNKEPHVTEALKEAQFEYAELYKFNNCALIANNKGNDENSMMCNIFWKLGFQNMQNFFTKLGSILPASLTLTKEVLSERGRLQVVLLGLQKHIQVSLGTLSKLKDEREFLKMLTDKADGLHSESQEGIEVEVPNIKKVELKRGEHVTNCLKCNFTCHYPCYIPDNGDKYRCWAITNEYCRICPNNCYWELHKNTGYKIVGTYTTECITPQSLVDKYSKVEEEKLSKEQVVEAMEEEIKQSSQDLLNLIQQAQQHVKRLEEIALKPNPLSTTKYIELMIESENVQKKHNYEKRIKMLEDVKKEAAVLEKLMEDDGGSIETDLIEKFNKM